MSSRKAITNFKDNLVVWKKKIGNSNKFVKIYSEYLNQPEGYIIYLSTRYMSLIHEFMNGYSLQDLINSACCINEEILRSIASQILDAFQEYTDKYLVDYGDICPCQILFTKEGYVKVSQ